ncbi:MAG: hypothetical protein L6R30_12445, partial [Thermoanaerobaculia bacterium]|nr:hypothetical protein [Thermoanaerobaculia bacterium]
MTAARVLAGLVVISLLGLAGRAGAAPARAASGGAASGGARAGTSAPNTPPASDLPPLEAGVPLLRAFSPKEYGASGQNWAVVQDPRGLVYVANNDGVLEFDGLRWRLIRTANRTTVRSLAVDATGRVWAGAKGDFGALAPDETGELRYVSHVPAVPASERDFTDVWQTFATRDALYFSTYKRLFRFAGSSLSTLLPETAFRFSFLVADRLFIREVDRGLFELSGGRLNLVPGTELFGQEAINVMLPWDDLGRILIGTRKKGCFLLDGTAVRSFPTEVDGSLERDLLYSAAALPDGRVALGTLQGGVSFIDRTGRWLGRLQKARGLPDDTVWTAQSDREGGLWLGLDRGVARLSTGSPLTVF